MGTVCACTGRLNQEVAPNTAELPTVVAATAAAQREPAPPRREPDPVSRASLLPDDARVDWDANAVMRILGRIAKNPTQTEYWRGGARVDERRGTYAFDCSGMVEWVLHKAAPTAAYASAQSLGRRPLAIDFYHWIASVSPERDRHGWRRVTRVEDAEPGDVIAWIKPPIVPSPNTGHVAFVVFKPARVPGRDDAFVVRIADSSSLLHEDDTRIDRNGFGLGTVLVLADGATGAPTGYGWVGLRAWTFETPIAIGRPLH